MSAREGVAPVASRTPQTVELSPAAIRRAQQLMRDHPEMEPEEIRRRVLATESSDERRIPTITFSPEQADALRAHEERVARTADTIEIDPAILLRAVEQAGASSSGGHAGATMEVDPELLRRAIACQSAGTTMEVDPRILELLIAENEITQAPENPQTNHYKRLFIITFAYAAIVTAALMILLVN